MEKYNNMIISVDAEKIDKIKIFAIRFLKMK